MMFCDFCLFAQYTKECYTLLKSSFPDFMGGGEEGNIKKSWKYKI